MAYLTEPLFDISHHKMTCSKGDFSSLYDLCHVNGQFKATFKHAPHPKRGSEIYIRKIPVNLLLQEILEFTMRAGDVYQIRILLEFSGYNRGYCFVTYFDNKSAKKAAVILNGERIRETDVPVVVRLSFDNNRLELSGIPKNLSHGDIFEKMSKFIGGNLLQVFKLSPNDNKSETTKCLLRYDTHKSAVEAKKKVYPSFEMFDRKIEIDWAVPSELVKSKRLYFENVPLGVRKVQLYEEFSKYINVEDILNMFLQKGIGYILFINESAAYQSFTVLRAKLLFGVQIRYAFMKFYSHLQMEKDNEIEYVSDMYNDNDANEDTISKGTVSQDLSSQNEMDTSLETLTEQSPSPTQIEEHIHRMTKEISASPDISSSQTLFSMSDLATSLEDETSRSTIYSMLPPGFNRAVAATHPTSNFVSKPFVVTPTQPTAHPPVTSSLYSYASQPLMMSNQQPALVPGSLAAPAPQYAPYIYAPCAFTTSSPAFSTPLVQPARFDQPPIYSSPPPTMHSNSTNLNNSNPNFLQDIYNVSGIPQTPQCDWVLARYQQTNNPVQIVNLSPVVNNVPYDLTVLQMTQDHYRATYGNNL
ncbi:hypothetical protein JTB14_030075 [Gonioctena quinquepunctata]|nr:hypothetical protein JTB14_030075 [Gonioctena quinquepunctata]